MLKRSRRSVRQKRKGDLGGRHRPCCCVGNVQARFERRCGGGRVYEAGVKHEMTIATVWWRVRSLRCYRLNNFPLNFDGACSGGEGIGGVSEL